MTETKTEPPVGDPHGGSKSLRGKAIQVGSSVGLIFPRYLGVKKDDEVYYKIDKIERKAMVEGVK